MLFKYIKLLIIVVLSYMFFTGCDDSVNKVGDEDHLGEFIHHVEHDHFEGTLFDTVSAGVYEATAPVLDSLFMLYRVVFSGTSGYLKYSFTDTTSHERTLVTDKVVNAVITNGATTMNAEDTADLTGYTTEFIKMASVYDMEPNTIYTIHITGAAANDTISVFIAPTGIEGEHEDH